MIAQKFTKITLALMWGCSEGARYRIGEGYYRYLASFS